MTQKQLKNLIDHLHEEAFLWSTQCVNGDRYEAAEVLQMVYLKIMEGKAQFSNKSTLKTWLFAIIRYTAIDHLRSQEVRTIDSYDNSSVDTADSIIEEEESYRHLLNQLSDKQRQVMLLVFYHDMTLEEVSKTLVMSIGTVRQHYARGKKKLKDLIIKDSNSNRIKKYA